MAFYLDIIRVSASATASRYQYSTTDGRRGTLEICHADGTVHCVQPMLGDTESRAFARAKRKIEVAWGTGQLPEKTCWAS